MNIAIPYERENRIVKQQLIPRDVIEAMFLGIACGDALGLPVETQSADDIFKRYGAFSDLIATGGNHPYLPDLPKGSWSDDTQLSLAVANAIISAKDLTMESMVSEHVSALNQSTLGWGGSTREAVAKLRDGVHWLESGRNDDPKRGTGNGVVMKVAPIAAYLAIKGESILKHSDFIRNLTIMTHASSLAVASTFAQIAAVKYCLEHKNNFDPDLFVEAVIGAAEHGTFCSDLPQSKDDLVKRLTQLRNWREYTVEDIISEMKGGCYVYESLPFALLFFLRNPNSEESMLEVIRAGGDTDSNGSIVGALIGALNGSQVFSESLVSEVLHIDDIRQVARELYQITCES